MDYPKKNSILFMWAEDENQEIEIMQYTGLKDKNGVEIYEGDICLEEDGEKSIIVFYANGWCMDMSKFYPLCKEGWCESILGNPILEVIGNIHENPELLEKGE